MKIFFFIVVTLLLNNCVQSTALMGPALTVASTGNVVQAGIQYGTNHAIKKETGKDAFQHIASIVEEEEKIDEDFIALLESHIKKNRKKIKFNY